MARQKKPRITLVPKAAPYTNLKHVALLLSQEQIDSLNQLERAITEQRRDLRGQDVTIDGKPVTKERRITKNAVIRCLIDILAEKQDQLDLANIVNESDLRSRLSIAFDSH